MDEVTRELRFYREEWTEEELDAADDAMRQAIEEQDAANYDCWTRSLPEPLTAEEEAAGEHPPHGHTDDDRIPF